MEALPPQVTGSHRWFKAVLPFPETSVHVNVVGTLRINLDVDYWLYIRVTFFVSDD